METNAIGSGDLPRTKRLKKSYYPKTHGSLPEITYKKGENKEEVDITITKGRKEPNARGAH